LERCKLKRKKQKKYQRYFIKAMCGKKQNIKFSKEVKSAISVIMKKFAIGK